MRVAYNKPRITIMSIIMEEDGPQARLEPAQRKLSIISISEKNIVVQRNDSNKYNNLRKVGPYFRTLIDTPGYADYADIDANEGCEGMVKAYASKGEFESQSSSSAFEEFEVAKKPEAEVEEKASIDEKLEVNHEAEVEEVRLPRRLDKQTAAKGMDLDGIDIQNELRQVYEEVDNDSSQNISFNNTDNDSDNRNVVRSVDRNRKFKQLNRDLKLQLKAIEPNRQLKKTSGEAHKALGSPGKTRFGPLEETATPVPVVAGGFLRRSGTTELVPYSYQMESNPITHRLHEINQAIIASVEQLKEPSLPSVISEEKAIGK